MKKRGWHSKQTQSKQCFYLYLYDKYIQFRMYFWVQKNPQNMVSYVAPFYDVCISNVLKNPLCIAMDKTIIFLKLKYKYVLFLIYLLD